MKILLTGKNRSGKTTLLTKLIATIPEKQGLITKEVRDDIDRIGFDLENTAGELEELARTNKPTSVSVGRYFIDLEALDNFIKPLFSVQPNKLLYVDEIGQMQLYSPSFKQLVTKYLQADNHFIGTITSIYKDKFVTEILNRSDVMIIEIDPENRDELGEGLTYALESRDIIASLSKAAQQAIIELGTKYLTNNQYASFKKLFKNAVRYVAEDRIQPLGDDTFAIRGDTNDHQATILPDGSEACDCDLFNGRGQFADQQGECSHLQAIQLYRLQTTTE